MSRLMFTAGAIASGISLTHQTLSMFKWCHVNNGATLPGWIDGVANKVITDFSTNNKVVDWVQKITPAQLTVRGYDNRINPPAWSATPYATLMAEYLPYYLLTLVAFICCTLFGMLRRPVASNSGSLRKLGLWAFITTFSGSRFGFYSQRIADGVASDAVTLNDVARHSKAFAAKDLKIYKFFAETGPAAFGIGEGNSLIPEDVASWSGFIFMVILSYSIYSYVMELYPGAGKAEAEEHKDRRERRSNHDDEVEILIATQE